MDEKYFKDKISGYFDGDLKPEEMEMMTEWLKTSPEGQKALTELGRLDEFVRQQSELSGSDDFWEKQAQKIEARLGFESAAEENITDIRPPKASGMGWKMIAVAASIVVLIYVGVNRDDIFGPEDIMSSQEPSVHMQVKLHDSTMVGEQAESGDEGQTEVSDEEAAKQEPDLRGYVDGRGDAATIQTNEARDEIAASKKALPAVPSPPPKPAETPSRTSPPVSTDALTTEAAEPSPVVTKRQASPTTLSDQSKQSEEVVGKVKGEVDKLGQTKDDQISPKVQQVPPPQPMTERAGLVDEPVSDTLLTVWRQTYARTDSTLNSLAKNKSTVSMPDLTNSLGRKAAPATSGEASIDKTAVEAEMLEACFNLAQSSPDTAEQTAMRKRLAAVAADAKAPNRKLAQGYLDHLTAPK